MCADGPHPGKADEEKEESELDLFGTFIGILHIFIRFYVADLRVLGKKVKNSVMKNPPQIFGQQPSFLMPLNCHLLVQKCSFLWV